MSFRGSLVTRTDNCRLAAVARASLASLAALLVVTGCGDGGEASQAPPSVVEPEGSGEASDSDDLAGDADPAGPVEAAEEDQAEPEPGKTEPEGPPVTIAFGGDVMFEGMIRPQLDADPQGLLSPIADVVADADLTVVNLETAITEGGEPAPKGFNFRAPATALEALQAGGIDVATLANNHGMDFGQSGLEDTLSAAEDFGFPLIGAGRDKVEAFAPYTTTIRGREIAVIGATQVMDSAFFDSWPATDERPGLASAKFEHEADLLDAVATARKSADTVVVYLHWGVEGQSCPTGDQTGLADRLADAGADIVVGTHAHRLQGTGMLGDTLVDYGLGNFVFYSQQSPGIDTGVLMVTVEGREVVDYAWVPARIDAGVPRPLEGEAANAAVAAWDELRSCTDLTP